MYIARAAAVPIIPVGYACVRGRFDLHRWDHWLMMAPFDRITITYGSPLVLSSDESLPDALERVTRGLLETSDSRPLPTVLPVRPEGRTHAR